MTEGRRRAAGAVVLAVVAAGCGAHKPAGHAAAKRPRLLGRPAVTGSVATDFALRDQDGRLVRLSRLRGRLVLLTFLYTHCTDVCPLVAANLDAAVRGLGHQAGSVRILAVSVDPSGDTPGAVRTFVRRHRLLPEFRWLLGTRRRLAPIWQAYNVLVERRSPERVAHATPILLIDRRGRPLAVYPTAVPAATVEHDLRALIRGF